MDFFLFEKYFQKKLYFQMHLEEQSCPVQQLGAKTRAF